MPPLLRLHYIGKCFRTTCARCGIDTPFDIVSNAFYSMRFGEEMREIQGGQVSLPPAPLLSHIGKCPRTTCARCGIVSPQNRLTNTLYSIPFREELREIWGGEVPPPPAYPCHPILGNVRAPPALGARSVRLAIACTMHFISCESAKIWGS